MAVNIRGVGSDVQPAQLRKLLNQFIPGDGTVPLMVQDRRVRWTPRLLVLTAVVVLLLGQGALKDRFAAAHVAVTGMYNTRKRGGYTYGGFMKALLRCSHLVDLLAGAFRLLMPVLFARYWHTNGREVFMVDGTRAEAPRTRSNAVLGCAGRKRTGPQFMLTMILHLGTGLPWAWKRGSGTSSERRHFQQMLQLLPAGAWLLADAGFPGHALLSEMKKRKLQFILRVGSNMTLLEQLYGAECKKDRVWLWPDTQRRKGTTPLELRLVKAQQKKQTIYLLVSELNPEKISKQEVLQLYRMRWGVEVFFRSLKQTMSRGRMFSDSPKAGRAELDWSVIAAWMLGMLMLQQMMRVGKGPEHWSVAEALRVVRAALTLHRRDVRTMRWLCDRLREALMDEYQRTRSKKSRRYPRKKTEKPAGAPKLRIATALEIRTALQLLERRHAA